MSSNIYRHKSLALTQFHLIPSSTKLYWPSTTKYQPVLPSTDLVLSYINRFEFKRNYQVWPPTCAKHYCRCTSSPASPSSSSPLSSLFLASQRRPSSGSLSEYNQVFCHDHRFSGTRIRNFPTRWEICCRYFCLCSVPLLYELWGFCEVNNKSQNVQLMLIKMHNFTGLRQTRGHIPWDES